MGLFTLIKMFQKTRNIMADQIGREVKLLYLLLDPQILHKIGQSQHLMPTIFGTVTAFLTILLCRHMHRQKGLYNYVIVTVVFTVHIVLAE